MSGDRQDDGDRDPGPGDGPGVPLVLSRCRVKLPQCCGEGMLQCQRDAGHEGMHVSADVIEW